MGIFERTVTVLSIGIMGMGSLTGHAQARPVAVRITSAAAANHLAKKVDAKYPEHLRKLRIQGVVTLRIRVNKLGDVTSVQLVSGDPLLAPYALDAVKQWKYIPFLLSGEPCIFETEVQVNFTLPKS